MNALTKDQIAAYNEMGQLLMDKLGLTSDQAAEKINEIMEQALKALENGCLAD